MEEKNTKKMLATYREEQMNDSYNIDLEYYLLGEKCHQKQVTEEEFSNYRYELDQTEKELCFMLDVDRI